MRQLTWHAPLLTVSFLLASDPEVGYGRETPYDPVWVLAVAEASGREVQFKFFGDVFVDPQSAVAVACMKDTFWAREACIETMLPLVMSQIDQGLWHLDQGRNLAMEKAELSTEAQIVGEGFIPGT